MKTESWCSYTLDVAESEDEVRNLYAVPSDLSLRKSLSQLDEHCRNFIARSPFLCLATSHGGGSADISPRGDAPGFVRVLDSTTLLIPDRLGNNRLDSLTNLIRNPHLALLLFIPGVDETLRINGRGKIIIGGQLLGECAANGKTPRTGLLIEVEEAFLQCAKALKRSHLWSDDYRVAHDQFPTLGKMLADQIGGLSVEELDCRIEAAYREKLY
jgi:PPOX class probable FMN-dependent enzyme